MRIGLSEDQHGKRAGQILNEGGERMLGRGRSAWIKDLLGGGLDKRVLANGLGARVLQEQVREGKESLVSPRAKSLETCCAQTMVIV